MSLFGLPCLLILVLLTLASSEIQGLLRDQTISTNSSYVQDRTNKSFDNNSVYREVSDDIMTTAINSIDLSTNEDIMVGADTTKENSSTLNSSISELNISKFSSGITDELLSIRNLTTPSIFIREKPQTVVLQIEKPPNVHVNEVTKKPKYSATSTVSESTNTDAKNTERPSSTFERSRFEMLADGPISITSQLQKVTLPPLITYRIKKPKVLLPTKPTTTTMVVPKAKTQTSQIKVPEKFIKPTLGTKAISKNSSFTTSKVDAPSPKIPISGSQKLFFSKPLLNVSKAACLGIMPSYLPIAVNGSYEVRDYPMSAWLSTNVITNNRILAELEARSKLENYFKGDNEKGVELSQTCPILTQVKFKDTFFESREKVDEYAISFYLPWDGNSEIPVPNDSEVLVDIVEERSLYVHTFKARVWEMTDSFLQSQAKKLTTELRKQREPFLSKYFYVASYVKSPMTDEYSTYEIWVYATRFRQLEVASVWQPVTEQPLGDVSRRTRSRVCKGFECPSFEVLGLHKAGIQKRRYYGARFATYDPEFCSFTKASIWRAFMPLHLYKHGVNSHFEIIGATRPAGIVHVKEKWIEDGNSTKVSCNQSFTVSLYLPKRLHTAPPVAGPSAPRIKITELDDVIVYVQSVGGFLLVPERIEKEIALFRLRLKEQHLCFRSNEYYLVVYDYITRFHGRLNEIWAVADRCPDSL